MPDDSVMADKCFTIEKYLSEKNVTLNMPPFCGAGQQFTTKQIALTQRSRVCAFLLNDQQASKGESYFGF